MQILIDDWLAQHQPALDAMFSAIFADAGGSLAALDAARFATAVSSALHQGQVDREEMRRLAEQPTATADPLALVLLEVFPQIAAQLEAYIEAQTEDPPDLRSELLRRLGVATSGVRAVMMSVKLDQTLARFPRTKPD